MTLFKDPETTVRVPRRVTDTTWQFELFRSTAVEAIEPNRHSSDSFPSFFCVDVPLHGTYDANRRTTHLTERIK